MYYWRSVVYPYPLLISIFCASFGEEFLKKIFKKWTNCIKNKFMYHRYQRSQDVIRHSHRFYLEHLVAYNPIGIPSMTNYPSPPQFQVEILDPPLSQIVFRPKAKSDFYLFESSVPVHTSKHVGIFWFCNYINWFWQKILIHFSQCISWWRSACRLMISDSISTDIEHTNSDVEKLKNVEPFLF